MKKIIFFIGFFTLLLLPFKEAFVCKCMQQGSPLEELQRADAVFSGTVVRIDKTKVSVGSGLFVDSYRATFNVEKTWKGMSKKMVTVNAGITDGM